MDGCPIHIRFSEVESKNYFVLASHKSAHTCHRTAKVKLITTTCHRTAKVKSITTKLLVPILKQTPIMTLKSLLQDCKNC